MTVKRMKQPFTGLTTTGVGLKLLIEVPLALAILFFCVATAWGTTIGIIWQRGQGVIIAADSKMVRANQSGQRFDSATCKIHQYDNLFFVASGVKTAPSYDIEKIAEQSLSGPGSISEKVERLRQSLMEQIPKVINQNPPIDLPLTFQFAVVGIDNCQPVVYHLYLPIHSKNIADLKLFSLPQDSPSDRDNIAIFLGRHRAIDRFRTKHPGWVFEDSIYDRLRELIRMEIKASPQMVGEPIDILRIENTGARWIGSSPDSNCPALGSFEVEGCQN